MAAIRYGIAGRPVQESLSPLLTALVVNHLGLNPKQISLKVELIEVSSLPDALAWGYAGAVPSPVKWSYTQALFGKFRTSALLNKAVEACSEVTETHVAFRPHSTNPAPRHLEHSADGLPTRMFDNEIWLNLTSPLKHQLDSSAVMAIDASMMTKSVNALRWDGKGWWCGGFDGDGVLDVFEHHGFSPESNVLGLHGGGGAARSTAAAWAKSNGSITPLESRRPLDEGAWTLNVGDLPPTVIVDFDGVASDSVQGVMRLQAAYGPMTGSFEERAKKITTPCLDGRWLLVAQHLACWRNLWAPELALQLPSLGLLLTKLVEAEILLAQYA